MTKLALCVPRSKAAKNALFHIVVLHCAHVAFVGISGVLWAYVNLPGVVVALIYVLMVACLSGYSVLLAVAALAFGLRDPHQLRLGALVLCAGVMALLLVSLWLATPWHLVLR